MVSRVALAGWFGSQNLGDELILAAVAQAVREHGAEPVAISIDASATAAAHATETIQHSNPLALWHLVRGVRATNAMALSGGVIQSETSPWNIPFHTSRLHAAWLAGRPAAAVGIGVGRLSGAGARAMARVALRRLRLVAVRDQDSVERLRALKLDQVVLGADPVVALQPATCTSRDTMCVILRPPNRRGFSTYRRKAQSVTEQWSEGLERAASAIDAVAVATGLQPRLTAFEASHDDVLNRAIGERMKSDCSFSCPAPETVFEEIAQSRLVIAMRYHGALLGLLHHKPTVVVDYSPKMASLAGEAGGWAPVIDTRELNPQELLQASSQAPQFAHRAPAALAALRQRLKANDLAIESLLEDQ